MKSENILIKPRLILLSDLFGDLKPNWSSSYFEALKNNFEVIIYDSCKLAKISQGINEQEVLHQQFMNGGLEKAAQQLLLNESSEVYAIGLSIGGTILWQAALQGLKVKKLIAISATRLRYERVKPNTDIQLVYGEKDDFKPTKEWFNLMNIIPLFLKGGHDIYEKGMYIRLNDLLDN